MTVQTQTITAGPYAGNGVGDSFNYSWRITNKTQVVVIETDDEGVETVLTVDTDYRVEDIGADGGGQIVRVVSAADTPLPNNFSWYIRSNFVPTQLTDFDSQGAFLPENHENAFDKVTRLIQQLLYNDDLTLMFSQNTSLLTFNPELPAPTVSLGYLRIKEDLSGLEWAGIGSGGIDLAAAYPWTGAHTHNGFDVLHKGNIGEAAVPPVNDANTSITLLTTYQSGGLVTTAATAVTITVENNATHDFPVGAVVPVYWSGVGQPSFVAGSGVTIEVKASEGLDISERYAFATLWQRATDIWVLSGSLA